MFLVDTNVISAGAPSRHTAYPDVAAWMDRNSDQLFVSAIAIAEIEDGIATARGLGASRKADDLTSWLETLLHLYGKRVVSFDVPVARATGVLADHARGRGLKLGFPDLAIAATARAHDLTVLTRNARHFGQLPVRIHDPFAGLPSG